MKKLAVILFLIHLGCSHTKAQAIDSVVKQRVVLDGKIMNKQTAYYNGRITGERYDDTLGIPLLDFDYYRRGSKRVESVWHPGYRIRLTYYMNGKIKEVDSTTEHGHWYKSFSRDGREKRWGTSGYETIQLDSSTLVMRDYGRHWHLLEELFFKENVLSDQSKRYEYYKNGKLRSEGFFITCGRIIAPEGISKYYYENGQLKMEGIYKNGKLIEVVQCYDKSGVPCR